MNRLLSLLLISFLLWPVGAYAGIGSSISIFSTAIFGVTDSGVAGHIFLDDINAAAEYDIYPIDAQTIINNIASPSSGASQTDYDIFRGADGSADTTDPTFNAGPPEFDSYDGGDYNVIAAGSNTTFLADLHKTDAGIQPWTLGFVIRTMSTSFSLAALFSTASANTVDHGILVAINGNGDIIVQQKANANRTWNFTNTNLSVATDYLIIVTTAGLVTAGGGGTVIDVYVSSDSITQTVNMDANTSTTNATGVMTLNAKEDFTIIQPSGHRVYNNFSLNKYINSTEATAIRAHYISETGLSL